MNDKDTLPFIFYDEKESSEQARQAIPGFAQLRARVVELKKSVLIKSLNSLVSDIREVIEQLPNSGNKSELETVSISVQVSATGGVAIVASAGSEISNAMTLTFRLKS